MILAKVDLPAIDSSKPDRPHAVHDNSYGTVSDGVRQGASAFDPLQTFGMSPLRSETRTGRAHLTANRFSSNIVEGEI